MISFKNYKILSYTVLALVVIISFALTNLLLNLVIIGKLSGYVIIYVILNLLLNFSMFFIVFRFAQQIIEKESALQELMKQFQTSKNETENIIDSEEEKRLNIEEIVQQIIPQSPQSLTIDKFTEKVLANIAKVSDLVLGVFYIKNKDSVQFEPAGKYAYYANQLPAPFIEGETLPGQVAKDKKILNINNIPEKYFTVVSGLGKSSPNNLLIIPVIEKDETIAVIELATFKPFDKEFEKVFLKMAALLGKILLKIK
jgi:putative methionine-R-sulfoxide reductase with GAF domain